MIKLCGSYGDYFFNKEDAIMHIRGDFYDENSCG